MKNNKLTKKILSFVAAFVLAFTMTSCNQDLMETIYTPDNNDVTFAVPSAKYNLDGEPLVVTIQRGVAKEALTVNLTLTDPNGVYTLSTNKVSFAAGEYKKDLTLSYNVATLMPVTDYAFSLSFAASEKAPAGYNTFTASALMPLEYQPAGTVKINGNYFSAPVEHKLHLAKYTSNYFMIENFMGTGVNMEFNFPAGGGIDITAPAFSGISGLISKGLKFANSALDLGKGPVTFWLDCDPNYIVVALDPNGMFTAGAVVQFDAIYQMGGGYYGWYKVQIIRQ